MKRFITKLHKILTPNQIIEDELLRYAYSCDASLYRMVPELVLLVQKEQEVIAILKLANAHNVKLTFRAAGTSLSGQAVTDQVLVMLMNGSWEQHVIYDKGRQITLEPGVIGAEANKYLASYSRQIGPDPGSINTAKIGGIVANNSSGMCCGVSKNTYATLANLRAVFANGSILDSGDPASIVAFKTQNPELICQIRELQEAINHDQDLVSFIRQKFAIKNTSGYSLNAFLDFADPIKIIERLLIGSEGTLGFISKVTLNTVPNDPYKALNLIYGTLQNLVDLTVQIAALDISSIELLDHLSLQSVANIAELEPYLQPTTPAIAAIMLELSAPSHEQLVEKLTQVSAFITQTELIHQTGFIEDPAITHILWKARKGILPTLAATRPLGSTVLIEDVAVVIELLPALINDLHLLFSRYSYANAAIFGHVLAGNIHFVLTPNFSNKEEINHYDQFMHEFTQLVAVKYHGSLKAEHGSGRNIAPFALLEWGEQCWDIMWQIKKIFDPYNILNPDVKLTRDNTLHLHSLKELADVDPLIDKCMECGFCEPVCPSRKLSLTPRQRNTVARKIPQLPKAKQKKWQEQYEYYGIDTCATTGMCQTACPVGINTGEFIRTLKPKQTELLNHANNLAHARNKIKLANQIGNLIGRGNLENLTRYVHKKYKTIPVYLKNMPEVATIDFIPTRDTLSDNILSNMEIKSTGKNNSNLKRPITVNEKYPDKIANEVEFTNNLSLTKPKQVILIPSCPNRIFANSNNDNKYPNQILLEKMGFKGQFLNEPQDSCCGQLYHSQNNQLMQEQSINQLRKKIPDSAVVLIDNSSCAGFAREHNLPIHDLNQFITEHIDHTQLKQCYTKLALHIDCSSSKHSFNPHYLKVLEACATTVVIPKNIACCGFAGDKGFSVPELNKSSLNTLASQVADCEIGVTFNRSCQIGLSYHSGIKYVSLAELVLFCWK